MPNYNIVVTAGYKPYTFDEMIKPLQMYKEEYDKMDAELQDINDKASLAQYYIDKKKDADILAIHDAYMNDLNALTDSFTKGGMTAEKRAMAKQLRKRYGKEISNILVAAQERQAEINEQRKAIMNNPDIIFSRDAQNTPLSHYYMNPTRETPSMVNLKSIRDEAKTLATNVTASYPKRTSIEPAYDSKGYLMEGWVRKITKAGPNDSIDNIMSEIDKNKDWDGESNYNGKYPGYAAIQKSLERSANISAYDPETQRRISQAISAGIREGIATPVSDETTQDPTYGKSSSSSSSSNKDKDATSGLGTPIQKTLSTPLGAKEDKQKKEDIKTLEGLNPLDIKSQEERGSVLDLETKIGNRQFTNQDKSYLEVTTAALDDIWREIKTHIRIGEKVADVARQQAAEAARHLSPKDKAALDTPMNTPAWGQASMYGAIGQSSNINTVNSKYAQQYQEAKTVYKQYDEKLNELKQKYYEELEKVLSTLPDSYKGFTDDFVHYDEYDQYRKDLLSDTILTDNAETFTLDDNVKKQLLPALDAVKSKNGKYVTGLYDLDAKKYVGANDVVVNKENEDVKGKINFAKDVSAGFEKTDDGYELVLYDRESNKRYAIRGIPNFDFKNTVGKQLEFLTKKTYDQPADKQAQLKPVKLPASIDDIEFQKRAMILRNSPNASKEEIERFFGIQINPENMQQLGTAGSQRYYGVKLRSSDGKNIINLVFDEDGYLAYLPGGTAAVYNPRVQSRTTLFNLLASKFLTDMVGNAWQDYNRNKDNVKPNR